MSTFVRKCLILLLVLSILAGGLWLFNSHRVEDELVTPMPKWSPPTDVVTPPAPCNCPGKSFNLSASFPSAILEDVQKRRTEEFKKHQARRSSSLDTLLFAPSNSPLQYPIQGFTVRPMVPTLIPGLAVHSDQRSSFKVLLNVTRGVLSLGTPSKAEGVKGGGMSVLTLETQSAKELNELLKKVTYTSTEYHIHTGDLVRVLFEAYEAVFPIVIRQPALPVLYDIGTELSDRVTVTTKTFMRYRELGMLISSLRRFYKDVLLIVADDSFTPENITKDHVLHYIMPGGQGWFAGRNLAVSQVTTKYFLWVDDDFLFTEKTKIEDLVEVMEAMPELDVVGGSVSGNQFYFSLNYAEGDGVTGGCLMRNSNKKFHSLPNYPQCHMVNGVVNFFLARTDAVSRVGFDPKLKRVAHSEFFMDGLGQLMVASCGHVSIAHQQRARNAKYSTFRHPGAADSRGKIQLHYYKNHLECINYG